MYILGCPQESFNLRNKKKKNKNKTKKNKKGVHTSSYNKWHERTESTMNK